MAIETSLAEKVTGAEEANDRLLAALGNDGELDLPLQDIKDRIGDVALLKDDLIPFISRYRFALAHFGEKVLGIECS